MKRTLGIAVTCLALLAAPNADAQAPSTPDIVRLADGSFYRGIIVESTPDHVSLLLASGETRSFARADVASAERETTVPAPALPPPPMTHLHAHTDGDLLTLHRITGRANSPAVGGYGEVRIVPVDQFEPMCELPCDVDVAPGTYQLAVSRSLGPTRRAGDPIELHAGELQLDVHYEDRQVLRIVGILTAILGGAGGYALLQIGWLLDHGPGQLNVAEMVAGGCIAAVGLGLGLALAFWWDSAEVHASVAGVPITQ